ncbi:MAG: hypothetical protein HY840_00325 [Bacteroidetes bacterium]|nr:hypothetical protein [Bacteroidota bacterium]
MKNKNSFFIFFLISLSIVFLNFREPSNNLIVWDQFGYYLYLPLTFIYHDLGIKDFSVVDMLMHKYQPITVFYQGIQLDNGGWVLRYTMGLAILDSPAFFTGHLFAYLLNYPMDGFSLPYQYALLCWSIVILLTGLYYLRLILLHFFSDKLAAFILLILCFGTNFLIMSTHEGILLVNSYLFTLFAIMLWHTIKWHEKHYLSSAIILGITLGLAALTRPTEIMYAIIPFCWGIKAPKEISQKIKIFLNEYRFHAIIMFGLMICIGSFQLFYWKKVTGNFFYDSYGANAGEGFDFQTPYTLQFLFSYRKGWLVYTPLMLFSIIGFIFLYRNKREIFWASLIFFSVFLYVVSSWTYWWYASCFSQRTMMQVYPLLAVSLGFFIQWIWRNKFIVKAVTVTLIFLFIALNILQSWQYKKGIISGERMTKKYYWSVFLKTTLPKGADELLLVERNPDSIPILKEDNIHRKQNVFSKNFTNEEKAVKQIALHDTTINFPDKVYIIDSTAEFFNVYDIPYFELTDKYYAWLQVKTKVMALSPEKKMDAFIVITFLHKDKSYRYMAYPIKNDSSLAYKWSEVNVSYLTPEIRSKTDRVQIYIWNRGKSSFAIDTINIEKFEPIENP